MFNDILTGKASLEPQARPPVEEAPPSPRPALTWEQVAANEAASARAVREAETALRKSQASHRLIAGCVVVFVAVAIVFIKSQMRQQMREDNARAAGYSSYAAYQEESAKVYPTDEYSYKVRQFAGDMCRCQDLACARNLQAQYTRYLRSSAPSDDESRASVEQDARRLADCQEILEAGGQPARPY
ncbi:MAG: hypothetical protein JNL83_39635 [Myxococcales bacterium]|nr:hypothetical protein [Myxococcales bacterium]